MTHEAPTRRQLFERRLDELAKKTVRAILHDNNPVLSRTYLRQTFRLVALDAARHPEMYSTDELARRTTP